MSNSIQSFFLLHNSRLSSPQVQRLPMENQDFHTYLHFPSSFSSSFPASLTEVRKEELNKEGQSLFSYFCSLAFVFLSHDSIPVCLLSSGTLWGGFSQRAWSRVWTSTMHRIVLWEVGPWGSLFGSFPLFICLCCA